MFPCLSMSKPNLGKQTKEREIKRKEREKRGEEKRETGREKMANTRKKTRKSTKGKYKWKVQMGKKREEKEKQALVRTRLTRVSVAIPGPAGASSHFPLQSLDPQFFIQRRAPAGVEVRALIAKTTLRFLSPIQGVPPARHIILNLLNILSVPVTVARCILSPTTRTSLLSVIIFASSSSSDSIVPSAPTIKDI